MRRFLLYAVVLLMLAVCVSSCATDTVVVRREYAPVPYRYEYYHNIYQRPRYSIYHPYYYHWYKPKPHPKHIPHPQPPKPKPTPAPAPNATVRPRPPRQSSGNGSMSGRRR